MSKSEKQYSMKLKYSVIIIALFLFQFFTSFVMAQNDEFETFNLNTKVDKVGWNEFVSLYKESGELYLPIVQLFEYLKINIEEMQPLLSVCCITFDHKEFLAQYTIGDIQRFMVTLSTETRTTVREPWPGRPVIKKD